MKKQFNIYDQPDDRKFSRVFWRDVIVSIAVTMFTALGLVFFLWYSIG